MPNSFRDLNLNKFLWNALDDLGFDQPTPIQEESFSPILSGHDVVGVAQTGTGKTLGYMLPLLKTLPFSKQDHPRILVLVPTRELVVQVVKAIEAVSTYLSVRTLGVYGGTNINTQKAAVAEGQDIIVATPGRLYDLAASRALQLKSIQKLVIDEVDVMLDLGFRPQLQNILDILPDKVQHILFSATMSEAVEELSHTFFKSPLKITTAASGIPLDNIKQRRYRFPNWYTKVNYLVQELAQEDLYSKTLIFTKNKRRADLLFEQLTEAFPGECAVIHSNKTQNYRLQQIKYFEEGEVRILIATNLMARGIDIDNITHVINMDTPQYPENYIHRIGRTGRAGNHGVALLFTSPYEEEFLKEIKQTINQEIPIVAISSDLVLATQLLPEERPKHKEINNPIKSTSLGDEKGSAFQEKKEKNKKVNQGGSYKRKIKQKYKKPKTRGDKNYNKRNKRNR